MRLKIRISSVGDNLWLGLDDISLTGYESFITIKSPVSGSTVGFNVDFMVDYKYISPSINYRWQRSADGNGWTDIAGSDGTATGNSGTFTGTIPAVVDGYYYRVLVIKGNGGDTDFTEALVSEPVRLFRDGNYLIREDFGGCGSTQDFIYKADNQYVIPGYEYTQVSEGIVRPNPGSGNYIITNQVYLNYWTNEDNSESTTNWNTDVTDHSSCKDGYFLLVHARVRRMVKVCHFIKRRFPIFVVVRNYRLKPGLPIWRKTPIPSRISNFLSVSTTEIPRIYDREIFAEEVIVSGNNMDLTFCTARCYYRYTFPIYGRSLGLG